MKCRLRSGLKKKPGCLTSVELLLPVSSHEREALHQALHQAQGAVTRFAPSRTCVWAPVPCGAHAAVVLLNVRNSQQLNAHLVVTTSGFVRLCVCYRLLAQREQSYKAIIIFVRNLLTFLYIYIFKNGQKKGDLCVWYKTQFIWLYLISLHFYCCNLVEKLHKRTRNSLSLIGHQQLIGCWQAEQQLIGFPASSISFFNDSLGSWTKLCCN